LDIKIEGTQRCTGRPCSSEIGDVLEGRDRVSMETYFEVVIKRVWGCNSRLRLSELSDTLRGYDRASLELCFEAMIE
jgi:hypothetical protein